MFIDPNDRYGKLFLVALAIGGLAMACFAGYTALRWSLSHDWPLVPCTITASRVVEKNGGKPYEFRVAYQYAWAGRVYTGGTYQEDYRGSADVAEADRLARRHPVGARRICFVNPRRPTQAILRHDSVWIPLLLLVGMVGASGTLLLVATKGEHSVTVLGGVFMGVVGGFGYVAWFAVPLWTWWQSQGWVETPCVVQSSVVRTETHHGKVTVVVHWPDIVYTYRMGGVDCRSNVHNASHTGTIWFYGPRRVVREHPPGLRTVCYVDLVDPSRAVLDRSLSLTQLAGLWPLAMAVLGLGMIVHRVTGWKPRLGSPQFWGPLGLTLGLSVAVLVLGDIADDLYEDHRAGQATPLEYLLVGIAGLVTVGLSTAWLAVVRSNRGEVARGDPP